MSGDLPEEPFDEELAMIEDRRARFEADVTIEAKEILGKLKPEARKAFVEIQEFENLIEDLYENSQLDLEDITSDESIKVNKTSKEYDILVIKYGSEFMKGLRIDDFMNGFDACGYGHSLYFELDDEKDLDDRDYYIDITNTIAGKYGSDTQEVYNYRREYSIAYRQALNKKR